MNDLISVIVPVYNVEKYIKRCIESIINQSYLNIEIILVNDGSTDSSGIICDKYSEVDNRIKVLHKKNGGLSDARNVGLKVAQGNYITFIDSDDWIHVNYIKTLYTLILKSNSDVSICNFKKTSSEELIEDTEEESIYQFTNVEALEQLFGELYVQMVIACAKLYKSSLFNEISFPVNRIHEDEFTTYKLLFKSSKVILTTKKLYYYWQRNDSITGSSINYKQTMDKILALTERATFFNNNKLNVLGDRTYKNIFIYYIQILNKVNEFGEEIYINKFYKDFKKYKKVLKKSKQSIIFKIFYETYYIFPRLSSLIFNVYSKIKR